MFQENVSLAQYSNYKIGGPARYFFIAKDANELREGLEEAKKRELKIFILGGGTNVLISDSGFDGLVIKLDFGGKIEILEESQKQSLLSATADTPISDVLNKTIELALSGLEWAGGLPGTIGGAVRGNAGAFKGEIKDSVFKVESLNTETLEIFIRESEECRFGYRTSIFKELEDREIIMKVWLKLTPGHLSEIQTGIQEKIEFRKAKHPIEYPNIGSIFKNVPFTQLLSIVQSVPNQPWFGAADNVELQIRSKFPVKDDPFPVIPTAFLIAQCELKGLTHGGAQVSEKHPNFIINKGGAASMDVEYLISEVKKTVLQHFGVQLEEEIQRVG